MKAAFFIITSLAAVAAGVGRMIDHDYTAGLAFITIGLDASRRFLA